MDAVQAAVDALYLGIEIRSLLHERTDGEPERVGQREIVLTGHRQLLLPLLLLLLLLHVIKVIVLASVR